MSPSIPKACAVLLVALGCVPTASGFGLIPLLHNNGNGAARGTGTSFVQASVGRVLVLPRHTARSHGAVLMAADGGDGKKDAKAAREVICHSLRVLLRASFC